MARGVLGAEVVRAAEAVLEAGGAELVRRVTALAGMPLRSRDSRAPVAGGQGAG